jgi:ATP-binding cassette subfamily B protein
MLKLLKYLKPFMPMVLLAIVLLFVQAMAELALPDYMSRIVDNGIQQGGVEDALPEAVRQSQMDRLTLFMGGEDKARVLDAYTLIDPNSTGYETNVQQYPELIHQPVYVLNEVDQAEIEALNPVMGKAFLAVSGLEQALSDPERAQTLADATGFDVSNLPAGMDLFSVLSQLPAEQRDSMTAMIDRQFETMGESMIVQSAVGAVKAEYAALGMDTGSMQTNYILRIGVQMLLISLLGAVCTVAVSFLAARTSAGTARDLRQDVFKKVESFSATEFDHFSTASLITRSTNDITQIQMVVFMMIRMVFYAPIMGVGGVLRVIGEESSMWWIIALAVGILLSMVGTIFAISLPKFKIIQGLIDRLNLVVRENLSGMMVIRSFNRQGFEENRFDKANLDLTKTNLFVSRVMAFMMPVMMLIMNGLSLLIIWVGAQQVAQANMQVGALMAFIQYAMQIVFSFLMLSFMFIILPRASVSANRIAEVLETKPVIEDPSNPRMLPQTVIGNIEFRDVSFRYPGAEQNVLCGLNFTARPGQTTALIGSTGSGKSTVVNLIPRFYDVSEGAILLDGVDIRELPQHNLRDQIGYIPQKSALFSGTIGSNLRYADENASEELLREAAEVAQASEFIFSGEAGLESEISQGGMNVSGGQKQRLSIARALVKKAPVLIFDDSFSALDFRTDAALRRALKDSTAGSTVLIVTQRVSTIKNAEQIIVLDEGQIVGKGTHVELMETCETYREIALSQLSMEELA